MISIFTFARKNSICAAMTLGLILTACQEGPESKELFVSSEFQKYFEFASPGGNQKQFVWQGHDFGLHLKSDDADQNKFLSELSSTRLAMVHISAKDRSQVLATPGAKLWMSRPNHQGTASDLLVAIENIEALEKLASLAHDTEEPLACGNIQVLQFTSEITPKNPGAPIYLENYKIAAVENALSQVSESNIATTMKALEDKGTRFHRSQVGLTIPVFIKEMFQKNQKDQSVNFQIYDHTSSELTTQSSLIAAIPGQSHDDETVIIGAHLDSIHGTISRQEPDRLVAPGADDDASGIAVLLEAFRVINENGWKLSRRVEFHAYGAEEVGLIGSTMIARDYHDGGRKVAAMVQLDMTAWAESPDSKKIFLVENQTSEELRRSLKLLLQTYLGGNYETKKLTAGTSDHASWIRYGYPAVFPFEDPANHNPNLHRTSDTSQMANNLGLAKRFTQLVLAFIAHMGGVSSEVADFGQVKASTTIPSDLFVALQPAANSQFNLHVSAPLQTASVEFCQFSAKELLGCQSQFKTLSSTTRTDSRHIFSTGASNALQLSPGQFITVRAFNSDDQLIAQRFAELAAP